MLVNSVWRIATISCQMTTNCCFVSIKLCYFGTLRNVPCASRIERLSESGSSNDQLSLYLHHCYCLTCRVSQMVCSFVPDLSICNFLSPFNNCLSNTTIVLILNFKVNLNVYSISSIAHQGVREQEVPVGRLQAPYCQPDDPLGFPNGCLVDIGSLHRSKFTLTKETPSVLNSSPPFQPVGIFCSLAIIFVAAALFANFFEVPKPAK